MGVARALAADPPILLMDEPFGALDPVTRAELQREFRGLAARLGKTIAFVTHDLREALLLGTRIALLADGPPGRASIRRRNFCAPPSPRRARLSSPSMRRVRVIAGNAGDAAAPPVAPNSGGAL